MARVKSVTKPVLPVPPPTEGEVVLILTYAEAVALRALTGRVGGSSGPFRNATNGIYGVLGNADIPSLGISAFERGLEVTTITNSMFDEAVRAASVSR